MTMRLYACSIGLDEDPEVRVFKDKADALEELHCVIQGEYGCRLVTLEVREIGREELGPDLGVELPAPAADDE